MRPAGRASSGRRARGLDAIDVKLLAALQTDGRATIQHLAEKVGLSPRASLERVRRLEAEGLILGYQAQIALERLSRPVTVIAEIALEHHGNRDRVDRRLAAIEEIVECWEVSGGFDYIARIVTPDLAHYEKLTAALLDDMALGVARIVSHVTLRPVRRFRGYPLALLRPPPE